MLNWILEKALSCAWKHSCHSSKLWIKSAASRQQMGGKCIKYDSFGPCQRMLCSRSICMENALVWSWMGRTKVQVQWYFFREGLKCHGNCGTFDDSPHPEHPGTYRLSPKSFQYILFTLDLWIVGHCPATTACCKCFERCKNVRVWLERSWNSQPASICCCNSGCLGTKCGMHFLCSVGVRNGERGAFLVFICTAMFGHSRHGCLS